MDPPYCILICPNFLSADQNLRGEKLRIFQHGDRFRRANDSKFAFI